MRPTSKRPKRVPTASSFDPQARLYAEVCSSLYSFEASTSSLSPPPVEFHSVDAYVAAFEPLLFEETREGVRPFRKAAGGRGYLT